MADQQRMLEDFAALPVTPEAKAALLSALPLPTLVGLLGDESRVELVCRCIRKLFSSGTDCSAEQAFLVQDGAWLIPAGLTHADMTARKTTVGIIAGLLPVAEHRAWLRSQGLFLKLLTALFDSSMQVSHAASVAVLEALTYDDSADAVFVDCNQELCAMLVDGRDSTMQLRAIEVVAKAWQISPKCTEYCRATPAKVRAARPAGPPARRHRRADAAARRAGTGGDGADAGLGRPAPPAERGRNRRARARPAPARRRGAGACGALTQRGAQAPTTPGCRGGRAAADPRHR